MTTMITKQALLRITSLSAALILLIAACQQTPVTQTPTDTNISDSTDISTTVLDFGETKTVLPLEITTPALTDRWTIQRQRSSSWLMVEAEQGTGSKTLSISIDRSKLPQGISRDTLIIRGLRRPTALAEKGGSQLNADTAKTIAVSVINSGSQRGQTSLQVLQQQLSSLLGGMQLPSRIDTTISFVGTFALTSPSNSTTYSALGSFVVGTSVLANVGASVQLVGRTNGTAITLAKQGISYTSAQTGTTLNATVYAPSTFVIPARNITFDGTTPHTFTVPSSSSFAGFTDNVASATFPSLTNPPTSIAQSSNLTLTWQPTSQADDSVFVVLTLAQDSIPRVVPTVANDNAGTVTLSQQVLSTLLGGKTGTATLAMVRFRYKVVRTSTPVRGLLSEAQRNYSVTVTQ